MKRIYLDNAATSYPKAPGTAEAITRYIEEGCVSLYRTESRKMEEGFDILYSLRQMLGALYSYHHDECIADCDGENGEWRYHHTVYPQKR